MDRGGRLVMLGTPHTGTPAAVQLLAGLPDFMLFCFDALEGNYVRGFGQAYPVSGNDLVMAERRTR